MVPLQRSTAPVRRIGLRPAVGLAVLLAAAALSAPLAWAQGQPTALQRLRAMLGIIRPVTVGGSRSDSDRNELCLLSPWVQPGLKSTLSASPGGSAAALKQAVAVALTPSGTPPIATAVPLAEVQIWRGDTLLWRGRASADRPLANPLAWPLPPLQPGESVLLKLRNQGASGGDFSAVELRRPQASASASPAAAGADPSQALLDLVQQGRRAEAMEALFQADLAGNPQLRQWARDTITKGCSASAPR
ncbi:MAG: hypothetical protein ACKO0M_09065 [Cyanobium sp.]